MKLTIFGASGRTGVPLVKQALAAGHEITAFVRDPTKLPITHERLRLVQGDAQDREAVARAVQGADAVISVIGPTAESAEGMQTAATRNIVAAMQQHGVKRLVSMTGAGVEAPQDQPKLINHIIKFALKTMAGKALRDGSGHAEVIRGTDLDWTIVRGPMLVDGEPTGSYRIGWVGVNTGPRAVRADIADFLLKLAGSREYVRQMPVVSN